MCKNGKRNSAKYPSERTPSHAIPQISATRRRSCRQHDDVLTFKEVAKWLIDALRACFRSIIDRNDQFLLFSFPRSRFSEAKMKRSKGQQHYPLLLHLYSIAGILKSVSVRLSVHIPPVSITQCGIPPDNHSSSKHRHLPGQQTPSFHHARHQSDQQATAIRTSRSPPLPHGVYHLHFAVSLISSWFRWSRGFRI